MADDLVTPDTNAIIRVGKGRGFIVEGRVEGRLVITAGHCLPHPPPACSYAGLERVYLNLLGTINAEPTVGAVCVFVDPIADIAVLGSPAKQDVYDEIHAYDALTEKAEPLEIGELPTKFANLPEGGQSRFHAEFVEHSVRMLSLKGTWFAAVAGRSSGPICTKEAVEYICPGMSGSPIIDDSGAAVGVFTTARGLVNPDALAGRAEECYREAGPDPHLGDHLPGWLWRDLSLSR